MPEKIEELVRAAIAAAQSAGDLPEFDVEDLGLERPRRPDERRLELHGRHALGQARPPCAAPDRRRHRLPPPGGPLDRAGGGRRSPASSTSTWPPPPRTRSSAPCASRAPTTRARTWAVAPGFRSSSSPQTPVGPLHIGHGRWVAIGDSLCRVFEHVGYDVEREYYVNDHGSQMDVFGHSISMRYQQLLSVMGGARRLSRGRA